MKVFRLNSSPSEDNPTLVKCIVIIAGMYLFYLLELTLHFFSGGHSRVSEQEGLQLIILVFYVLLIINYLYSEQVWLM